MWKRKKKINYGEEILNELKEIHSILGDEQEENEKLHWLILSQDNEIRKLKEKNKEIKQQKKEEK